VSNLTLFCGFQISKYIAFKLDANNIAQRLAQIRGLVQYG